MKRLPNYINQMVSKNFGETNSHAKLSIPNNVLGLKAGRGPLSMVPSKKRKRGKRADSTVSGYK